MLAGHKLPPRTAAHRSKIRANTRAQHVAGRCNVIGLLAACEARTVQFTDAMNDRLIRRYWEGRHMDMIATEIGVCPETLRRQCRKLGLLNRRHVRGFFKYAARA
jgi:hypothetical protein